MKNSTSLKNPNNLTKVVGHMGLVATLLVITACSHPAPSQRPVQTQTANLLAGDAKAGQSQFEHECSKCHTLIPGKNEKGPQLMRVYGAQSALLTDYNYSDAMKNSKLVWTADNLDKFIADPKQTLPNTRMKSKPISDAKVRQDIIAYLSTLR